MTNVVIMNVLVAAASLRAVTRVFRYTQPAEFLVAWFVLALAQVITVEILLGIFALLTLANVMLLTAAVFLAVFVLTRGMPPVWPAFYLEKPQYPFRRNTALLICTAVILGFGVVKTVVNLVNAPFGWDSLNYHFTFPVEWLKNAALRTPAVVADDPSPAYYPINGSLVYLWLMLPLRSVFLADLGQAPFYLLGFSAVFAIARRTALSREYAFFAAALFTLIPNYFKQLEIAYVDVMVAALFLAAFLFLARLYRRYCLRDVIMCGIATGLLLGTKTVALPYSILLCAPPAWLSLKRRHGWKYLACGLLSAAVFGGFSYLRNFVETGNPLYPCDFRIAGRTIFPGVMDISIYSAHVETGKQALTKLLFHEGMGGQTLIFIVPGIFASAAFFFRKRNAADASVVYSLVIAPVLLYLMYRYLIPLANSRYLYPALGLGMISGLYAVQAWGAPRRAVRMFVILCAVSSLAEISTRAELVTALIVSAMIGAGLWFFRTISQRQIRVGMLFLPVVLALAVPGLTLLHERYLRNEYAGYIRARDYSGFWPDAVSAWKWLDEHTKGDNIAYMGRPAVFPLYGAGFKNNVYYTSVNPVDPMKLHFFPGSRYQWGYSFTQMHDNFEARGNYRGNADYSTWMKNLMRRRTDYLFVYSLHQTDDIKFPIEDAWAREHPAMFAPVFSNGTIRIYKVGEDYVHS